MSWTMAEEMLQHVFPIDPLIYYNVGSQNTVVQTKAFHLQIIHLLHVLLYLCAFSIAADYIVSRLQSKNVYTPNKMV